jgi:hypothetical protein
VISIVRSSALGFTTVFARIGGALSPWLCQWLYWRSRYLAVFSCVGAALVAAYVASSMPKDTRGEDLDVRVGREKKEGRKRKEKQRGERRKRSVSGISSSDSASAAPPRATSSLCAHPATDVDTDSAEDATFLPSHHAVDSLAAEAERILAQLNLDVLKSTANADDEVEAGSTAPHQEQEEDEASELTPRTQHKIEEASII